MLYALALIAGIVAGSRAFTAPAAVSWAARLGFLNLDGSWLAFMGYAWTPWIFSALAIVEYVTDQLPSTPSRKVPMQFGARLVSGALCGATIGTSGRIVDRAASSPADRRRHRHIRRRRASDPDGEGLRAAIRRRDSPKTPARSSSPSSSSWRSDDAALRRHRRRGRPGRAVDGGAVADAGKSVAIVERKLFGGTCVNVGCTPTKTLVASAYAAHLARRARRLRPGRGPVSIDFAAVMARKTKIVDGKRANLETWLAGTAICTIVRGQARFVAPHAIEVAASGSRRIASSSMSARARSCPISGRRSDPAADQFVPPRTRRPAPPSRRRRRQLYRARVRPDLPPPRLDRHRDREGAAPHRARGSRRLRRGPRIPRGRGIAIRCGAECISFKRAGRDVEVGVDCQNGEPSVMGSHTLIAVGRRPNTDDLGLDAAGVKLDARGFIVVDDELRTSATHIFALGDCNGRGAFTHTSYNDYEICAANLSTGASER